MRLILSVLLGLSALLMPAMGQAEALKLEVKEANVGEHWVTGKPTVEFVLTEQSARTLWEFSKKNIDKRARFSAWMATMSRRYGLYRSSL